MSHDSDRFGKGTKPLNQLQTSELLFQVARTVMQNRALPVGVALRRDGGTQPFEPPFRNHQTGLAMKAELFEPALHQMLSGHLPCSPVIDRNHGSKRRVGRRPGALTRTVFLNFV